MLSDKDSILDRLGRQAARTLASTIMLFALALPSFGQDRSRQTIGGLYPVLPKVPLENPRPAEGPDAAERWQIERPARENAPVASLVDSLKGNDTAFHVVLGQGRLLTTRSPIASEEGVALIAVGDPTIVDFDVLPNPRMIRLIGKRAGVTDLAINTDDGQVYNFEVHVGYDLDLLQAQLRQAFPDAWLKLGQIREHLIVEGQARSPAQVTNILQTLGAYLESVGEPQAAQAASGAAAPAYVPGRRRVRPPQPQGAVTSEFDPDGVPNADFADWGIAAYEQGSRPQGQATVIAPQIINLIRVPGVQQVLLKVRIAELDRTALREIGADMIFDDGSTFISTILGNTSTATVFGVFDGGKVDVALAALRRNSVATVLAEPNLVAMSGHRASFLAGGSFPVPVPQQIGGGGATTVTVQFKEFGVLLNFVPYVLDNETIRLHVAPEVSRIDEATATTLVEGGDPIPGLLTRSAETTVELRQGQTLAIAGIIQSEMDSGTSRIPVLGDLPYVGPFFSNTRHQRMERELLVLVTPYLASPVSPDQVVPLPGTEVRDPDDHEFYLLNRIEGRTGRDFRPTTVWDNPFQHAAEQIEIEQQYITGPSGFSHSP